MSLLMAWSIFERQWILAGTVFVLAVTTDLLDGYAARKLNATSPFGGLLDHSADAVFVIITIGSFAWINETSMLLPMLTALAFAQYAIDSNVHHGQSLIASRLGRYNGIGYFLFAGALVLSEVLNPNHRYWSLFIRSAEIMLVMTTTLSMADRLRRSLMT
jgi:phosphatidylglycerophosphate synthase